MVFRLLNAVLLLQVAAVAAHPAAASAPQVACARRRRATPAAASEAFAPTFLNSLLLEILYLSLMLNKIFN